MRSERFARTLLGTALAAALLVGGPAAATAAGAAPAPAAGTGAGTAVNTPSATSATSATSGSFAPQAVVNLGLSRTDARYLQCYLRNHWGYTDAIDGLLGTNSWKAMQRRLVVWGYDDAIDGDPGPNTIRALQRLLKAHWSYTGAIDGIAGPKTRAAFQHMASNYHTQC